MKLKRNLLLIFFILAGIVLGGMLANLCANIPFLSWLAYSSSIGFKRRQPICAGSLGHQADVRLFHGHQRGADHHHRAGHFLLQQNEPALSCGPALLRKEGT